jgi:hypothetical protein
VEKLIIVLSGEAGNRGGAGFSDRMHKAITLLDRRGSEMNQRRHCRVTRIDTYIVGARWCNWVFAPLLSG